MHEVVLGFNTSLRFIRFSENLLLRGSLRFVSSKQMLTKLFSELTYLDFPYFLSNTGTVIDAHIKHGQYVHK